VNTRSELLEHAHRVLDSTIQLGACSARTAALLGRCAFEQWLDEQSATWSDCAIREPTTTSKLVVLSVLRGVEVGEQAKRVWNGLSRACHHHAYELQPSAVEVRHWLTMLGQLNEL
jgi:hypothetical protein